MARGKNWRREKKTSCKKTAERAKKLAKSDPTGIAPLIAALVLDPLATSLEENKKSIQALLNKKLSDQRLYIFVDDLDRANPEALYGLLMFLNEVVDLNRCVF